MKYLFSVILLLLPCSLIQAQHGPPPDDERSESLRIAFLTQYLELTPKESEKFWPIYNIMREEAKTEMEAFKAMMDNSDIENMSEEGLNELLASHFKHEQSMLDIRKKYSKQFQEVLPTYKVVKLARAEEQFKREILRHARDKRPPSDDRKGPRPGQ